MSSTRLDIQGNGPPDLSFLTHAENGSWREISGWLLPVAAEVLYAQARTAAGRGAIVEIGSFAGKSTVCIARGLQDGHPEGKLWTIDIQFQARFDHNLEQFGVRDRVEKLEMRSLEAADTWFEPIAFLFIDGSHRRAQAYADFVVWDAFLQQGAVVALDDTAGFHPGCSLSVQAALSSGSYERLKDVGGITFLQKKAPLVKDIGYAPLTQTTRKVLIAEISAWTGAMDPLLTIPLRPRLKTPLNEEERSVFLNQYQQKLAVIQANAIVDDSLSATLAYLKGVLAVHRNDLQFALTCFSELKGIHEPLSLEHYAIEVRHLAALRLAQVYDLLGERQQALQCYQDLAAGEAVAELRQLARQGIETPYQTPAPIFGQLLREHIIDSPLAKYRSY